MKNVFGIKKLIKKECATLGHVPQWFFAEHLEMVKKNASYILEKLLEVDKEVVMLGVWLHDTQRIRGIEMDH